MVVLPAASSPTCAAHTRSRVEQRPWPRGPPRRARVGSQPPDRPNPSATRHEDAHFPAGGARHAHRSAARHQAVIAPPLQGPPGRRPGPGLAHTQAPSPPIKRGTHRFENRRLRTRENVSPMAARAPCAPPLQRSGPSREAPESTAAGEPRLPPSGGGCWAAGGGRFAGELPGGAGPLGLMCG